MLKTAIGVVAFLFVVSATGQTSLGLRGQYFDSANLNQSKLTRVDSKVDFSWGSSRPTSLVGTDRFFVQWNGSVEAPVSGLYTIYLRADDGVRLRVDNRILIDDWRASGLVERSATISLVKGKRYNVSIDYYENTGSASVRFLWKAPGLTKRVVSSRYLSPNAVATTPPPPPEPAPPPQQPAPQPPPPASTALLSIDFPLPLSNAYEKVQVRGVCQTGASISVTEGGRTVVATQLCNDDRYNYSVLLASGPSQREIKVSQVESSGAVKSVSVSINKINRCALAGIPLPSAPFVTLDAASMPEKTWQGQVEYDGAWLFYFNSMNSQYVSFPRTGYYAFRARARSTSLGITNPKMQIAIDGRVHSETDVKGNTLTWYASEAADSVVEVFEVQAGTHKVSVGFGNWSKAVGEERYQNLAVKEVSIYPVQASCDPIPETVDVSNKTFRGLASVRGIKMGAVLDTGIDVNGNNLNVFKQDSQNTNYLKTEFNHVMPGSAFLMDRIAPAEGVFNFSESDEVVNFALANGMSVTAGHLLWYPFIPQWLKNKNPTAEQTKAFLRTYIQTLMGRYKGKVKYWIVVNEAFADQEGFRTNNFWYEKLGADHVRFAFETARAADPSAVLLYNDYDIDEFGRKSDAVYAYLKTLKSQGVPIDAIGFQGHLRMDQPLFLKSVIANMERFAALSLRLHMSEVDVAIPKPYARDAYELQAQHYRNMLKACLSVSACDLFLVFGTVDKYWWWSNEKYGAGSILYDDYTRKPAYDVLKRVLYGVDPI